MRVLLVEDEPKMAALLARGLREEGHAADVAVRGEEALWMAQGAPYDAIVLDVMLPGLDGFATCRKLREDGVWTPVLMLTARDAVEDRVEGLDAGADDYLLKPFSFSELLARLRALVRRAPAERPTLLEVGDLKLDPAARRAWRGETELELSVKEFALLEVFMRRPGEALSRLQLLEAAWDMAFESRSNLIDVYVRYLREKIDRPFGRDSIETIRGVGYRLREGRRPVSRLPIRVRLTLPFAVGMAVVLAAAGFFIYVRVGGALLGSVDQRLRVQAQEVSGRVEHGRSPARPRQRRRPHRRAARQRAAASSCSRRRGRSARSSPASRSSRVLAGGTVWRSGSIAGLANDWRILAVPAQVGGGRGAIVVAQSLEPREEALHRLVREFMLGGSAALLLAILAGYAVAAAALRPVEAMRRRAAAIGAATPEKRLPVPPTRDELSRLAETLNDMLGRLQSALEHERRFVDDASHELRTPLALLKTELEIALRQPRSRDELEAALRSAADETDRLTRLAEDLLLVARADEGRLPIRLEQVSARQLLADVAARFEVRGSEHGRPIVVADGPDATVEADVTRLEQALGNLVDNALVHGDGKVVLSVRDDRRHGRAARGRRRLGLPAGLRRPGVRPVQPGRRGARPRRHRARARDRGADRPRARRERRGRDRSGRRRRCLDRPAGLENTGAAPGAACSQRTLRNRSFSSHLAL